MISEKEIMDSLDLSILKTLINNKKHALDFSSEFSANLFTDSVWQFANILLTYIKTYKDVPTLRVLSERASKNIKQVQHIQEVWIAQDKVEYDYKDYKFDLEKIKKRFAEKQILSLKETFSKIDSQPDIDKTIADMQRTIQNVRALKQTKSYDKKTLKEHLSTFKEEYNAKLENPNFDRGVMTRYSMLDDACDGLRPGELLLIGGESSSGKSMLLMNMAIQLWLQDNVPGNLDFSPGHDVLYFSLEMPYKPCFNRVLSRLSQLPSKRIRNAKLDKLQMGDLKKSLKFIDSYPNQFEIVDIPRGATMEYLETVYLETKLSFDPKIVVIDYLGLMECNSSEDDWLKLGFIAGQMHEFARAHNLIVLSAVQLNRIKPTKDEEDAVGMHRIGRSALIMHHANIGIQIAKRAKEKSLPDMEYHIIKCRDGELSKGYLTKDFSKATLLDQKMSSSSDIEDISEQLEGL